MAFNPREYEQKLEILNTYKWIKVGQYIETGAHMIERFDALKEHHLKETEFLIAKVRELVLDGMTFRERIKMEASRQYPNLNVWFSKQGDRIMLGPEVENELQQFMLKGILATDNKPRVPMKEAVDDVMYEIKMQYMDRLKKQEDMIKYTDVVKGAKEVRLMFVRQKPEGTEVFYDVMYEGELWEFKVNPADFDGAKLLSVDRPMIMAKQIKKNIEEGTFRKKAS